MDTLVINKYSEIEGFCSLYYLLIEADGVVHENEVIMGKIMCKHEKFDIVGFQVLLNKYKNMDKQEVYKECIAAISRFKYASQVRCLAWMSNIANSDGFMGPEEWKLIFRIYKKELNIRQEDIITLQKQLPKH
jgi:uncharacterized tellurite resistance protein B-like protein